MTATENPLLETWNTPFGAPPFSRIKPEHFVPAYERAFAEHEADISTIAGQEEPPTFDNTIIALENAGRPLQRVDDIFGQLVGTDSNDTLLAIERDISPRTAAHWNKVRMNDGLFARLDALHQKRDSIGLTAEQIDRYRTFLRLAEGSISESALAEWLTAHTQPAK